MQTEIGIRTGQRAAVLALLAMAACWGSSFPLTKVMLRSLPAQDYLVLRFTAAAILTCCVAVRRLRRLAARDVMGSLCLGALYGCAQLAQVFGLRSTPASESGFIIGLSVVITPLIGFAVLRQQTSGRTWTGVSLAFAGLALLSLSSVDVGLGQVLTLLSATIYATHIVAVSRLIRPEVAVGSSVMQLVGCAAVCWIAAGGHMPILPHSTTSWLTLTYLSVVVAGIAMVLQIWAQARLSANRSALAMSTEPIWAAALAVAFLHEELTLRLAAGGAAMVAGVLVLELGRDAGGSDRRNEAALSLSEHPDLHRKWSS